MHHDVPSSLWVQPGAAGDPERSIDMGVVRESLQFGRSLLREALIIKGLDERSRSVKTVGRMERWDMDRTRPDLYNNPADQAPLQLGVMASGSGSNFEALVQAIQAESQRADRGWW